MDRRKAIATAGAATAVAVTAVIAVGANVGIFGLTQQDTKVGRFPLVDATTATTTRPAADMTGESGTTAHPSDDEDRGHDGPDGRPELERLHDEDD